MHTEINFDAIQSFGLVLKKINQFFVFYLVKIEGSLQKYRILMLNMTINSYKLLL